MARGGNGCLGSRPSSIMSYSARRVRVTASEVRLSGGRWLHAHRWAKVGIEYTAAIVAEAMCDCRI